MRCFTVSSRIRSGPWEALAQEEFPHDVLTAVACLTRREKESYSEFIERIEPHPLARRVKIADLEDNMMLGRISFVTEDDFERLKKYQEALKRLQGEITW